MPLRSNLMIASVTLSVAGCGLFSLPNVDNSAGFATGGYLVRHPTGSVMGRFVDKSSQQGIQGVLVEVNGGTSTYSDSTGTFILLNLPIGSYSLTFDKPGYDLPPMPITVTVDANTTTTVPQVELEIN